MTQNYYMYKESIKIIDKDTLNSVDLKYWNQNLTTPKTNIGMRFCVKFTLTLLNLSNSSNHNLSKLKFD